jgi:uncharacterized protein (DUF1330 family)
MQKLEAIMPVFFLAEIKEITDDNLYGQYIEKARPIIERYGGEYILRSEQLKPISGDWDLKRIILIRFASIDKLHGCFQSDEYRKIAHLRENSTVSKAIVIEE